MSELYVGLISGTSVDGVDAVLAEIDAASCRVVQAVTTPYPYTLLERLQRLIELPQTSLRELGALDHALGHFFGTSALAVIERAGVDRNKVAAIGHHGQTVFHEPNGDEPFSMQLGDPNVVAADTGLCVVADFRRLDMACGGQGAPLVPAFHAWCFGRAAESCAIVNIGGIANITALAPGRPPLGFDTGPGNTLLDLWIRHCRGKPFDRNGDWAATGTVDRSLLNSFLAEPYLAAPPPKSTGREMFHMAWLEQRLARCEPTEPADVQATLAELTASTIATAIERTLGSGPRVIVCGGGAYNSDLMRRLGRLTGASVETTAAFGIAPDWVEGAAFAWLARERLRLAAGNVPSVTGSRRAAVLGGIYWGGTPKSL